MATTDEDMNQLERDVRQLKIEYEQYFGGGRPRPPADIEWRIEQIIRRYGDRTAEISFAQRFRYNNLTETYAKYREIFRKRMRQKEEGAVPRHFGAAAKAIEEERRRSRKHGPPATLIVVSCSDPDREGEKVKKLYRAFCEAKESAGEKTAPLTLAHFQDFLRRKTQQLKKGEEAPEVEYVVALEQGQVRLKARIKN